MMKRGRSVQYYTIEKHLGETPLEATERMRKERALPKSAPLAYAGRLDPMATGTLLVLIGEECKHQKQYHAYDKAYQFQVLFGVQSDTGDVLGIVRECTHKPHIDQEILRRAAQNLEGAIALPYPHFSAKTVQGKPLHTWTLEGRLHEIDVPTKHSTIHTLTLKRLEKVPLKTVLKTVRSNIETIPKINDPRKKLGRDFRRTDVRASWTQFEKETKKTEMYIATFTCIASSGTYMRSLAEAIAKEINTCGLAYSIHRTTIGTYRKLMGSYGFWTKRF